MTLQEFLVLMYPRVQNFLSLYQRQVEALEKMAARPSPDLATLMAGGTQGGKPLCEPKEG